MRNRNTIPVKDREIHGTILDPIYMAANELMKKINTKTSALTDEERKMAVAVTLYCGSHSDNPFVT